MRVLGRLQTAVGLAGAVGLVALVVAPDAVPLPETVAGTDLPSTDVVRKTVAAVLGLVTVAIALASQLGGSRGSSSADGSVEPLVEAAPEAIHGRSTGYPRPAVDDRFARIGDGDADREAVADLSGDLRETAVRLYAAETGRPRDEAAAAIDGGDWTDDERAAAFVGRDAGPLPLRARLWDYVRSEDADHRRARRAVEALESLAAADSTPTPSAADDAPTSSTTDGASAPTEGEGR
ncbi:DUF7269 family protein [Halomicrobium urmianum]|uniref:DUF7269 family protein n=1 Tax=Halomicrobium urmianum TaxID=1586233 RepID=UPI001CDA2B45|nr:hypothetical protein [Halomicrobium urmianum]